MATSLSHATEATPPDTRFTSGTGASANGESSLASASTHGTPAFSPLYQQIKGLILRSLQSGEWKPGDVIPSEFDLAARFRVSQGTVRKAIDELATDNLLVRRQGKGTFVATHAEQHIQYRFLRLLPDTGDLDAQGPAERRIVECKRLRASADVARQLGLRTGDPVLQVRRVLAFAGAPAILEDIWLPGSTFKGLTLETLAEDKGPMYALFESQFGVRMVRAVEKLKAVSADQDVASLLGSQPGAPLLSVERVAYTYNDEPMELRRGLYRTENRHYRNELS
jgi:GntR family transcriptional regulator